MISAFVVSTASSGWPRLVEDLESVGITVLGKGGTESMVQDVIRNAPDLVVCYESHPDDALFAGTHALNDSAPRPIVIFTTDPDAEKIELATRSGVHAYVINGYAPQRLRSVIHVAQARFRYVQVLRNELSSVNHRFAERKLVDRAKGILMRLRDLSEDEAYAELRTAAMKGKRRIGQAAQQVIDAARYGEAVNRAGQLRMLSQRLVKLYAFMCADTRPLEAKRLFDEAVARVDGNLASLGRTLSKATFGDLLDAVAAPWDALRRALTAPPDLDRLGEVDRLAERLLLQAEQLTQNLEHAGFAHALRLINVAGRQRMLSQRLGKQAMVNALSAPRELATSRSAAEETRKAYTQAMVYLDAVPLRTAEIVTQLEIAAAAWTALLGALLRVGTSEGRREVFDLSEALLAAFETLTELYERNLQALME